MCLLLYVLNHLSSNFWRLLNYFASIGHYKKKPKNTKTHKMFKSGKPTQDIHLNDHGP